MNSNILALIDQYMPANENSQMLNMVRYAVDSGGKRIRPLLMLECAEQLGGIDSNIERLAVALECMHSYSLVHDDLPCMDDDDYRRGMPSCHKQFGYAEAVLTGDYLLNSCAEIVLGGDGGAGYLASARYLFTCGRQMIEGQIADIHVEDAGADNGLTLDGYRYVALNKTGALLSASLVIPALYHNMTDIVVHNLEKLAHLIGLMYQLADDMAEVNIESCNILQILDMDSARCLLADTKCEIDSIMTQLQHNNISLPRLCQLVDRLTNI